MDVEGQSVGETLIVDRAGGAPPYAQIVEHVRRQVRSGKWPVGHRLPSVNEWQRDLGLAKATIQRALRDMAQEGLVVGRRGAGVFVAERPREEQPRQRKGTLAVDDLAAFKMQHAVVINRLGAKFGAVEFVEDTLHPDLRHVPLDILRASTRALAPLDDLLAEATGRDFSKPDSLDFLKVDGRHHVVPGFVNVWVLGFNVRRFEEAGVGLPTEGWTWEEMLEAAERLTDARRDLYGITVTPPSPVFLALLVNAGGDLLDETGERCLLDQDAAVEAGRFLRRLAAFGPNEPPDPVGMQGTQRAPIDFACGRAAMNLLGVSTALMAQTQGQEIGALSFPGRVRQTPLMGGRGWGLDRYSGNEEMAREALRAIAGREFLCADPGAELPLAMAKEREEQTGPGAVFRREALRARTFLGNVQPERLRQRHLAAWPLLQTRLQEITYGPDPVEQVLGDTARQVGQFLARAGVEPGMHSI